MGAMQDQYGSDKGERVFYASKNKGTISGVDKGGKRAASKGKKAGKNPFGKKASKF